MACAHHFPLIKHTVFHGLGVPVIVHWPATLCGSEADLMITYMVRSPLRLGAAVAASL